MNPGFHLSCDENLSKGWGPPLQVVLEQSAGERPKQHAELLALIQ